MPLWGNLDNVTGNQKPLFANTSNVSSNSTINGTTANVVYGFVYGVSVTEFPNTTPTSARPQHSGWVSQKIGKGPISAVAILTKGTGINAAGFLILSDTSYGGGGSGANISFTIANTQNSLQSYSTNPTWNGVGAVTLVNGGSGFSNVSAITTKVTNAANTTQPTFTITLGGRAGRIQYETLVATGSITGDDPRDNPFFPGT